MMPAVGFRWPEIMLMKVVLPAPLGPMTQRSSPLSSVKSTASLARRPSKRLVRPSVRSSSTIRSTPPPRHQTADGAGDAAAQIDDHQHEQDAECQLPVARDHRAQIVGQGGYQDSTEQRAEQRIAPADRDPDHDFGREQHAGE